MVSMTCWYWFRDRDTWPDGEFDNGVRKFGNTAARNQSGITLIYGTLFAASGPLIQIRIETKDVFIYFSGKFKQLRGLKFFVEYSPKVCKSHSIFPTV
jgi:hypothetical protein